ncbi:MAG: DUF1501 domain-containing protein [Alphaproteobacteria bacterium]|nr:DUF1501 domain-containing protein [Alphaproteobacteria bacterium]MDE2337155.1 DUF1501 domain-containing protein [Alphaproteobacteria bacterium]
MTDKKMTGQSKNISRRRLLQGFGALGASTMFAGAMFSGIRVAFASAPVDARFVFVILRGAMDGLNVIPPYGDGSYVDARNGLALQPADYAPLDNFYGAHNNLSAFTNMFQAKEALALQAVATPYRLRSHFDGQNVLESGGLAPHEIATGWLNRALALYGARDKKLGLAVGQSIPLTLQGKVEVATWAPDALGMPDDTMLILLDKMYKKDALFEQALNEAVNVHNIADQALGGPDAMKKMGGGQNLQNKAAMQKTAAAVGKILSDPQGPRIATMEINGWDTHFNQGTAKGPLANNLAALDAGFGALKESLGAVWGKTAILAATEFGRTVRQNGTAGTDHGTASCAFLLGGAVNGGQVVARWPGLNGNSLYQNRDLAPTMDLRQAAKAVLVEHLELELAGVEKYVFPQSAQLRPLEGLIRT